jgi:hypothetical protein
MTAAGLFLRTVMIVLIVAAISTVTPAPSLLAIEQGATSTPAQTRTSFVKPFANMLQHPQLLALKLLPQLQLRPWLSRGNLRLQQELVGDYFYSLRGVARAELAARRRVRNSPHRILCPEHASPFTNRPKNWRKSQRCITCRLPVFKLAGNSSWLRTPPHKVLWMLRVTNSFLKQ